MCERESESESKVLRWKKLVFSAQKLEDEREKKKAQRKSSNYFFAFTLHVCPLSLTILEKMGGNNSLPTLLILLRRKYEMNYSILLL